MRVVVTRPHADALRTAERLAELGHEPALSPVLSVRATGAALPEGPFDAVLATSANAFVGLDRGASAMSLPIFTVGESTAAAARRAGFDEIRQGPGGPTNSPHMLFDRCRPAPSCFTWQGATGLT